jgi:hypothetical protein
VAPVAAGRGEGSLLVDETVEALTYSVTGLEPSTPYYVRVQAVGGEWSPVVSATTTAGGGLPAPMPIVAPSMGAGGMTMKIQSVSGITYALEYTTNLTGDAWMPADSVVGNGGEVDLDDADPADVMRYYRIVAP